MQALDYAIFTLLEWPMIYFSTEASNAEISSSDAAWLSDKKGKQKNSQWTRNSCYDPNKGEMVTFRSYCIYGITYTHSGWGNLIFHKFDRDVKNFDAYSISAKPLQMATFSVCSKLKPASITYGQSWLNVLEGQAYRKVDLFFSCCTNCSRFSSRKSNIRLMLINICVAQMAINRIYSLDLHREMNNGARHTYYREWYRLNTPMEEYTGLKHPFASCLSNNFKIVSSMLNNFLCQANGEYINPSKVYKRKIHQILESLTDGARITALGKVKLTFGPPNAALLQKLSCLACENFVPRHYEDECRAMYFLTGIQINCCCYGHSATACQNQLRQIMVQRDDTDPELIKSRACFTLNQAFNSTQNNDISNVVSRLDNLQKQRWKIFVSNLTKVGDLVRKLLGSEITNGMVIEGKRKFCVTNVTFLESKVIIGDAETKNVSFRSLKRKELQITNCSECEKNFVWDYRLEEIYRPRCFVSFRGHHVCPSDSADLYSEIYAEKVRIFCCCKDKPFCNHDADLFARVVYDAPRRCYFNNDYQHHYNKFLTKYAEWDTHCCLVHFASAETMIDLVPSSSTTVEPQALTVAVGMTILPTDFQYPLFEGYDWQDDGSFAYVETIVNKQYLETQRCTGSPVLETEYLPLTLLVYACKQDKGFTRDEALTADMTDFCDGRMIDLKGDKQNKRIKRAFQYFASQNECVNFTATSFRDLPVAQAQKVANYASRVCYTSVTLLNSTNERETGGVIVTAGVATRRLANIFKVHLDHIGYAMLGLSNSRSAHCSTVGAQTVCFCRTYERHYRDSSAYFPPCNGGISTAKVALASSISHAANRAKITVYEENMGLLKQSEEINITHVKGYCNRDTFAYTVREGLF